MDDTELLTVSQVAEALSASSQTIRTGSEPINCAQYESGTGS